MKLSRNIGAAGIKLIQKFEGCRLKAYKAVPTETYYTIGWGHYGPDVYAGMTITQEEADALLLQDLQVYVGYVNNPDDCPVTNELNQNQFDALVSFTYNCGVGSLRQLCRNRTIQQIPEHITAYNKSGGVVLAGLTRRREAEKNLYNTPVQENNEESEVPAVRYNTLEEVPEWGRTTIQKLINKGYLSGNGQNLDISEDMLRVLVINDRAGVYGE